MNAQEIEAIESALGIALPAPYRAFLASPRDPGLIDDTTVLDDPQAIIEATRDYRNGFGGLPPWPAHYLYVGDEADACPYVLDCVSGTLFRSDKGHPTKRPLERYSDFAAFVAAKRSLAENDTDDGEPAWRDRLRFYAPAIVAMLLIFVVIPVLLMLLTAGYRALFGN